MYIRMKAVKVKTDKERQQQKAKANINYAKTERPISNMFKREKVTRE